jgi:hypothetical protein
MHKPDEINIKPFDAGYNIVAGIELKSTMLKAGYSYGFSKVYQNQYRNLVFSLSTCYFFKRR